MTAPGAAPGVPARGWDEANHAHLADELQRLRLLLHRRVLWLRHRWKHDPLQSYQALVVSDAQADRLLLEDHEDESRFRQEDPEAAALGRSLAAVEQRLDRRCADLAGEGTAPAVDRLAALLGLTAFERDLLLLCLAPELDDAFERLYAYVQDDVTRGYATLHLARTLFLPDGVAGAEERFDVQDALLPQAPLRRLQLVIPEPGQHPTVGLSARPLRLDDRVADFLRGVNRCDERVARLLRPVPPAPLGPAHEALVDRLEAWARADHDGSPWPAINLVGSPGSGRRAVAVALCDRLGIALRQLDPAGLPEPGAERWELLRLLEREALLLPLALYAETGRPGPSEDPVADLVEQLDALLLVASLERCQSERALLVVHVPKPDPTEQRQLWLQALGPTSPAVARQVDAVVQQFDLGPHAIAQAAVEARNLAQMRLPGHSPEPEASDLWRACREQAAARMDDVAQRLVSGATWDDIVLDDDTERQLLEIATQVAHRPTVYETWGFGARLRRGRGISCLFSGPPGTGKTMAAEILAGHLEVDLYRIDLAGVVSKYIGETEKNLRRVFDAAERGGAILFFDEADALFGKRTEVRDSHDRYANIEIDYLLQRMEAYRGLAILATNRRAALDQAFLRRLRFVVEFPFPDRVHRRLIWRKAFSQQTPLARLDYDALALLEVPGANVHNIALNAAFLAAAEAVPVGMPHVMHAARREYAKEGRVLTPAEFGPWYERLLR